MCGEDEEKAPDVKQAPAAPTADQLTSDAIAARNKIFDASLPQLGQLGQELTNVQGNLLPQVNQLNLQQRQLFGPQLISLAMDMAKQADPSGFQLSQTLKDLANSNLGLGGSLSPEEQRLMTEDLRAGQVNRGFGTGLTDAIDEARFLGTQRFGREQARIGNAVQALGARDPSQSFMGITDQVGLGQTPNMAGIAPQWMPGAGQFMGLGNDVWQNQVAANDYNNEVMLGNWQNNRPAQSGGLMGGLSGAFAGASAGSALGPWGALGGAVLGGVAGGLMKKKQQ